MARVIILDSFEDDLAQVSSHTKRVQIIEAVALLERFPRRGSTDLPASTQVRYGNARKIVISPFDLIYTYDEDGDAVIVQGIVHQRGEH